jgi:colicin import membrane protein
MNKKHLKSNIKQIMLVLFLILTLQTSLFAQSKKELGEEFKKIQDKLELIQRTIEVNKAQSDERINSLEKEINILRSGSSSNFSSRVNPATSIYSDSTETRVNSSNKSHQNQNATLKEGDGLTPKTGATIYTGPRGGQYYINKNGNKTYIKKKN